MDFIIGADYVVTGPNIVERGGEASCCHAAYSAGALIASRLPEIASPEEQQRRTDCRREAVEALPQLPAPIRERRLVLPGLSRRANNHQWISCVRAVPE